jgi:TPR repeat protein
MRLLYQIIAGCMLVAGVQAERLYYTTEQKQWGLATSALLTYRHDRELFALSCFVDTERSIDLEKRTLERWWGVSSREDILETMSWLKNGGHRAGYEKIRKDYETLGPKLMKWRDTLSGKRVSSEYRYSVAFVEQNAERIGDKSLIGWDLMRLVSMARWGVTLGYLTEDEVWDWIMPSAQELQRTYGSWADMGEGYLDGRRFWSAQQTRKAGDEFLRKAYWLNSSKYSPWVRFDWDLDLTGSSTPVEGKLPEIELYYLGAHYETCKDHARAREIYLRVKNGEGSDFARGKACNRLGSYYEYGRAGIAKDLKKALEYYAEGAELEESGCLDEVGYAYFSGAGCKRNFAKAREYWERGAAQGSVTALQNLGVIYNNGAGVKKDVRKAWNYYEKACINGSEGAPNGIAWMMYKNDEIWDADEAVRMAYIAIERDECGNVYDTLVKVLVKAERWGEASDALKKWERCDMGQRNNYDPLKLPAKFKRLRAKIEAGVAADKG